MSSEKKTVRLMLDYMQGPIWISDVETGEPLTGIKTVDNDEILTKLNLECSELYNSCYEFNTHGKSCWFDEYKLKNIKVVLLSLLNQIKARLNEINDGSFVVEDLETERLKNL